MRIFIAGDRGMVGSSLKRALTKDKNNTLITATRSELNLLDQASVNKFFKDRKIDQVYIAAAKVGGIHANNEYPAQFIYENLMIQTNIIHAAHQSDINKIIFLGSSCIYPKLCDQPIKESFLLNGALEATNEPYAIAKIAGIKLCESYNRQYGRDYRCVMPTNLYGPNDNFHPENSHVIPGMMSRFHYAVTNNHREIEIWGSGSPMREFLHVDDMASASIYIMNLDHDIYFANIDPMVSHINVGTGIDCTIKELAETMSKVTGFNGRLEFNKSKPDGTIRKLMDVSLLNSLGWKSKINLEDGLIRTYDWFKANENSLRIS